jgi:ADP-ribose pyrophosphatase YjhB (NUDIX family)
MKHEVHDVGPEGFDKPVRRSVAVVVHPPGRTGEVLIVRRPADDPELPNSWGLPAATLRGDEDWSAAAERALRDKLGVGAEITGELNHGRLERADYLLDMRLVLAEITGEPRVPQAVPDVTQYSEWRWGRSEDLLPAAEKGSLCSRLYIASERGR